MRNIIIIFSKDWAAFFLFFLVASLLYANSLYAPFYFDDIPQIVNRSFTYDLTKAGHLLFKPRGLANFTFALNYHFFGMSLPAFHVFNILLHFSTTCFVFLALKRVFPASRAACYLGAIVFLCHPLQTQTVNYIVQRMTGLCGFFLFLSLYLFIRSKEEFLVKGFFSKKHIILYLSFIVTAALAVVTKQNAATIPILFLLFESVFMASSGDNKFRNRIVYLLPMILTPVCLGLIMVVMPLFGGETLAKLGNFENLYAAKITTSVLTLLPLKYFITELSVFWIYIKLLFIPVNQALDYGYPVIDKMLTFKNIFAALGVSGVIALAWFFRQKWPQFFFFIAWFCVSLAVESTFIPLDPIYEHRLYIPMFGFSVLLSGIYIWIADCKAKAQPALVAACLICICLAGLTVTRNFVWADPIKFFQNEVQNTYGSYRPAIMLADEYYKRGEVEKAKTEYDRIVSRIEQVSIQTVQPKMLLNIAVAYGRFNDFPKAESLLRLALKRAPQAADVHYNLGIALYLQGRQLEAYQEFSVAWKLSPGNPDAFYYYILLTEKYGDRDSVRPMLDKMQLINADYARKLKQDLGY